MACRSRHRACFSALVRAMVVTSNQPTGHVKSEPAALGHGGSIARRGFFPSPSREGYMSNNTMLYALYRMGYHGRATVHGFRAKASSALNEMGFRPDVIERQLAHQEQNAVRAAYNRAEYLNERRAMMKRWADHLDVIAGENIVPYKSNDGKLRNS